MRLNGDTRIRNYGARRPTAGEDDWWWQEVISAAIAGGDEGAGSSMKRLQANIDTGWEAVEAGGGFRSGTGK